MKFKIGDKVKIIGNSNGSRNKIGDIGTITKKSTHGDCWEVEVPGRKQEMPCTGAFTKELDMEKVEGVEYEDQWHLNDGKVTIPDDADKLEKDGSVVAFRKRKLPVFKFGDKVVSYTSGKTYVVVRKNTHSDWYKLIGENDDSVISVIASSLTKV